MAKMITVLVPAAAGAMHCGVPAVFTPVAGPVVAKVAPGAVVVKVPGGYLGATYHCGAYGHAGAVCPTLAAAVATTLPYVKAAAIAYAA